LSRGRLEQVGTPQEVYGQPANEFVARFIGVMNVLDLEVRDQVARLDRLEFPAPGHSDGDRLRIGFRPYAVQVSPRPDRHPYRAVLRHTFFLGIMMRLELELPCGVILRSRMTKEEYEQLGLAEGMEVSFHIRHYRVLGAETEPLAPEVAAPHPPPGMPEQR
jgi:ABC-type Fe3+/spermidine/putrescine transport system ATPase subunit